jgi:transposase-like protein
MSTRERFVADVEAARLIGVSPQTLRNWRSQRKGPPYSKRGHFVRYYVPDLFRYLEEYRIDPESHIESEVP